MRAIQAMIRKNLTGFVRDRARLFMSLIMPFFMAFTCSFLLKASASGIESPVNYLMAGIVMAIVFQGVVNNSTFVLHDISSGFMKEIIVAPVSRRDIAVGNILSAAISATVQGCLVLAMGFALGFRTTVLGLAVMVALMLLSSVVLSSVVLFLSLAAKNQGNYQIISSLLIMPAMFLSGAYIPTTLIPSFLLPLVYLNPLTYLTAAFRYVALQMFGLPLEELLRQGVAFRLGGLTVTPAVSWAFALGIGCLFFFLCIDRFKKIDLLEIKGGLRARRA